jgi:hypothetical protein
MVPLGSATMEDEVDEKELLWDRGKYESMILPGSVRAESVLRWSKTAERSLVEVMLSEMGSGEVAREDNDEPGGNLFKSQSRIRNSENLLGIVDSSGRKLNISPCG